MNLYVYILLTVKQKTLTLVNSHNTLNETILKTSQRRNEKVSLEWMPCISMYTSFSNKYNFMKINKHNFYDNGYDYHYLHTLIGIVLD